MPVSSQPVKKGPLRRRDSATMVTSITFEQMYKRGESAKDRKSILAQGEILSKAMLAATRPALKHEAADMAQSAAFLGIAMQTLMGSALSAGRAKRNQKAA